MWIVISDPERMRGETSREAGNPHPIRIRENEVLYLNKNTLFVERAGGNS